MKFRKRYYKLKPIHEFHVFDDDGRKGEIYENLRHDQFVNNLQLYLLENLRYQYEIKVRACFLFHAK